MNRSYIWRWHWEKVRIVDGLKILAKSDVVDLTGCVWDTRTQRLYFVDIDGRKVFTYEPSTGIHGFQLFAKKMTALALRQAEPGVSLVVQTLRSAAYRLGWAV
jgi:hypothetical protein